MTGFLTRLDAFTLDIHVRCATYLLLVVAVLFAAVAIGKERRRASELAAARQTLNDVALWDDVATKGRVEATRQAARYEKWWRKSQCLIYTITHSPEQADAFAAIETWEGRPEWWQPRESMARDQRKWPAELDSIATEFAKYVDAKTSNQQWERAKADALAAPPLTWSSNYTDWLTQNNSWTGWAMDRPIVSEVTASVREWIADETVPELDETIQNEPTGARYRVIGKKSPLGIEVSVKFVGNCNWE